MDQNTSSYTSSSTSSSSYLQLRHDPSRTIKSTKPSYLNSLHSVRKPTTKPFIAPLPPTPPKIYDVDSSNFKKVVQVLTSSPKFQSPPARRLKDRAPPPLVLSTIPKPPLFHKLRQPPPPLEGGGTVSPLPSFTLSPDFCNFLNETLDTTRISSKSTLGMDYFGALSPLGLSLSPTPRAYGAAMAAVVSPVGLRLSPSSLSWCSSVLLSPGTLSGFGQSPFS